jgi:hypothetical protein
VDHRRHGNQDEAAGTSSSPLKWTVTKQGLAQAGLTNCNCYFPLVADYKTQFKALWGK